MRKIFVITLLVLMSAVAAIADKITLKDGRVLEGKIVSETEDSVKIRMKLGESVFKRNQIEKIEYCPVPEEEVPPQGAQPNARPKTEREALALVRRYLSETDPQARERIAETLQGTLEKDPELFKKAARKFRKYTALRKGHMNGSLEVEGVKTEYALYVPSKYDRKKPWPLIVALHGGSGNGPSYVKLWHFPVKGKLPKDQVIKHQQAELRGYIVVAPTAHKDWRWGPGKNADAHILALIGHLRDKYHIDPDRIYVHGLSMGGHGAWRFGLHFADRFGAIEPRAAGCDKRFLVNARNLPVYITHGAKDETVPVKYSREAAAELKKLGYDYHYSEIPEGGHQFFIDENRKVLDFFDKRKRNPYPREVTWLADTEEHGRAYWLQVEKFKAPGMAKVEGSYDPETNLIEIKSENAAKITVYINSRMVDFSRPVTVKVNGKEKHNAQASPSAKTFLENLHRTRDEGMMFESKISITIE